MQLKMFFIVVSVRKICLHITLVAKKVRKQIDINFVKSIYFVPVFEVNYVVFDLKLNIRIYFH